MEGDLSDKSPSERAECIVEELYAFSNNFIESHGIEAMPEKQVHLKKKLQEALTGLDNLQLSLDNKATFFRLRGIALNVLPDYDARAVDCLSKAIKLEPGCVKSWNTLGECYWKNKDIKNAMNCFSGALKQSRNKEALRNMSMVLRQIATDAKERLENIKEGVKLAKEAVALDVKDGTSWFVLGNAYLSQYFNCGQSPAVLRHCMVAYEHASSDAASKSNPDLFFNRGVAYKYQETYGNALKDFHSSSQLDPFWEDPKDETKGILNLLEQFQCLTTNQGKLKPKKFKMLIKSLKEADLGPYGGEEYTSATGLTVPLKATTLATLVTGANSQCVVSGKVISVVETKGAIPYALVLADSEGSCIAVTVYNLAIERGILIGDSVAIPEPYITEITVDFDEKHFSFRSIRVDNPIVLVINRRKVGMDRLSFSVLSVTNISG